MFVVDDDEFFTQNEIIANFNKLAEQLQLVDSDIGIENLANGGYCHGLSTLYAKYAHEGKRLEFICWLEFIKNLNDNKISNIVQNYQQNQNLVNCPLTPFFGWQTIPRPIQELIQLMKDINSAQKNQLPKHINAHWDKTRTFLCHKHELESKLNIEVGRTAFVQLIKHTFYIERTPKGFYLFEPNHIDGFTISLLDTVDLLTDKIITNYSEDMDSNDNFALSLKFISFDSQNTKDGVIDTYLSEFKDLLNTPNALSLISQYHHGKIARHDLASALLKEIDILKSDQNEIFLLQKKLNEYIEEDKEFLTEDFKDSVSIHGTAFNLELETSAFILACYNNQIHLVEFLLDQGANVNQIISSDGFTPLYVATFHNNVEIVKLLLEKNADVNLPGGGGFTSFHCAIRDNNIEIFKMLLEKANLNQPTNDGHTPLYFAIEIGNIEMVKILLEKNANNNLIDERDCLLNLVKNHSPEVQKELIQLITDKFQTFQTYDQNETEITSKSIAPTDDIMTSSEIKPNYTSFSPYKEEIKRFAEFLAGKYPQVAADHVIQLINDHLQTDNRNESNRAIAPQSSETTDIAIAFANTQYKHSFFAPSKDKENPKIFTAQQNLNILKNLLKEEQANKSSDSLEAMQTTVDLNQL
jgi:ankyrin repeat protein